MKSQPIRPKRTTPTPIFVARPSDPNIQDLSPARKQLLALMIEIRFGRIENLHIRDGEPVLDPLPRVLRSVRFGHVAERNAWQAAENFVPKKQVIELFEQFDQLRDGTIARLDLKGGLPCSMIVEGSHAR